MRRLGLAPILLLFGCGSDTGGRAASGTEVVGRATGAEAPSPRSAPPAVRARPGETLAVRVVSRVALRRGPSRSSPVALRVRPRTEFGGRTVMAVLGRRGRWVSVHWPGLDNGRRGWVRLDDVAPVRVAWRIDVDLSARRATLLRRGDPVRSFPVAIGRPGTETPTGTFGITDRITTEEGSVYGCCILALSGRQPDVPQGWVGGDRLALHGTSDPASVGTAASSGCLRASERTMRLLMRTVPVGTRVRIRR